MRKILIIIATIFIGLLLTTAIVVPTAVDIEIHSNDSYKSIEGQKYIVVDGVAEEITTWKEFTDIVNENSYSENEDTAIQVIIESNTITNWSGLWRGDKTKMLTLGMKDSIWELNLKERTELFDSIKTYINPTEKATRTIQFIAVKRNSSKTLNIMEIKSTADNSVDEDLEWLQDSTAYENKETKYYILYGIGMAIAILVELTIILSYVGIAFVFIVDEL